nr:hypothetical protein [Candidatus Paceibacterota bacterium]
AFGVAVLAFFAVGTGITYASQNALPGDALYGIKVAIAEPIEAVAYQEPQEKALWRNVIVERRLHEATLLEQSGKLDQAREAEVALQVEIALDSSEEAITLVEVQGDVSTAEVLRASLASSLRSFADKDSGERKSALEQEEVESNSRTLRALIIERTLALEEKQDIHNDSNSRDDGDHHEYVREEHDGDVHATTLIAPDETQATTTESVRPDDDTQDESSSGDDSMVPHAPLPNLPSLGL